MANEVVFNGNKSFVPRPGFGLALHAGFGSVAGYTMPSGADGFTVEFWDRTKPGLAYQVIFHHEAVGYIGVNAAGIAEGRIMIGNQEYAASDTVVGATTDYRYHHWAFCYSAAAGSSLFIDGKKRGSVAPGVIPAITNFTGTLNFKCYAGSSFVTGGSLDEVAIFSGVRYTNDFTPPTAPIPANEPNLATIWRFDGDGQANTAPTTASPALTSYAPNDAALITSPYNSTISNTLVRSNHPGWYMRTIFSGSVAQLAFDVSNGSSESILSVRIDGQQWERRTLASLMTYETDPTWHQNQPFHLLEAVWDARGPGNRFSNPPVSAVQFTGISIQATAVLRKPTQRAKKLIWYGTSIVEGFATKTHIGPAVTNNSAVGAAAYTAASLLGCEFGLVGFGSSSFTAFSGDVPPFPDSCEYLWSGQLRSFADEPDYGFIDHGINDGTNDVTAACITSLNKLLAKTTNTLWFVLRPLGGGHESELQAAVAGCSDPSRAIYLDTTGFHQSSDAGDLVHLFEYAGTSFSGPALANKVRALLDARNASAPVPTGILLPNKNAFTFLGTAPVPLNNFPGLSSVYELQPGQDWAYGKPNATTPQSVTQFTPGRHYYVLNTSGGNVTLPGALV